MWNDEWTTQKNTTCGCQKPLFGLPANTSNKINEYLELLQNTDNINFLTSIFSNLGIYTLTKNIGSEIVKYEPLYEKILLVLNSGLQVKITITLNFISALLYLDDDGPTRKKALYIYAQNMLRNSGCLTAMSNIFASFMLYRETLKALCHSISEAVRDSSINQSFCSHLVPLCIQKCRSGSSEIFSVLHSLLNKHKRNVQLFHQNKGMELFSRATMQSTLCLQLLNTVVENTESEEREIILNSSHIFEYLLNYLKIYDASTSVSQWASIILYSYQKVLGININLESILSNVIVEEHRKSICSTNPSTKPKYCTINPELNETKELFRNILNEIIGSQGRRKSNDGTKFQLNCENTNSNIDLINRHNSKARERQTYILKPQIVGQNNNLSFSFLSHEAKKQNKIFNHLSNYGSKSIIKDQNSIKNVAYSNKYDIDQQQHLTQNCTNMMDANIEKTLLRNSDKESVLDFKPFFASTPKKRMTKVNLTINSMSQTSAHTTIRTSTCRSRHPIMRKIGRTKREYKKSDNKLKNKSVSSKFLDIVNASCTTIVKSFTNFKNIFKSKKVSESFEKNYSNTEVDICSYSFTNYMRERDAILKSSKDNTKHSKHSMFSMEANSSNDCNTCNDTIALKQKLGNNSSLQRTVKKLKMGINLYGCDFKKISKAMWPQEKYMTPSVLYNLYRKLIIK